MFALGLAALLMSPIQANSNVLGFEGRPAPRFDAREHVGPRMPSLEELQGKVILLFFWAHWCSECKSESPTIGKLTDKYRSQGLVVVAPTQRYGYVAAGRPAPPDKELRYIVSVRDAHYGFLRDQPVPVGEGIHKAYGISSVPTLVLIDRRGVIRLYHPGTITNDELEAAILKLL
jgi:thiol-disulfide isomerase/thioredoxin